MKLTNSKRFSLSGLNNKLIPSITLICFFALLFASSCKSHSSVNGPTQQLYAIDTLVFYDTVTINQIGNLVVPTFVSLSAPLMFANCKNILNVDLPGNPGRLMLAATSASVIVAPNQSRFSIIPTSNTCFVKGSLIANGDEQIVYQSNFKTSTPPKPNLQLIVNGREFDGISPISKNSRLTIKIKPDTFFAENFTEDATYEIDEIDVLVQRSLGAPSKVGTFNSNRQNANNGINLNTSTMFRTDPPGTKCYIKIGKVSRRTSDNQLIEVAFTESELILGFIIK